jgi:predicted RNase H-like nuclease (RuvC/YqgF family)
MQVLENNSAWYAIMATPDRKPARFRSATEFPKTIENLSHPAANQLYDEIRECLIFTNRSRAQLLRRNEEHKKSTLQLKSDVERLQTLINQLTFEKQQLTQNNQLIISDLEHEIGSMTKHLDKLSAVFDAVSDVEDLPQTQWSFLSLPSRFFSFIREVKAIVLSWREENNEEVKDIQVSIVSRPQLPGKTEVDDNRIEQPQMYTDPASINRSLLDR